MRARYSDLSRSAVTETRKNLQIMLEFALRVVIISYDSSQQLLTIFKEGLQ